MSVGRYERQGGWTPPSPHFVNNVIATVAGTLAADPEAARETLVRLGSYLGARLDADPPAVALLEEIELIRDYLALEEARFPGRVVVDIAPKFLFPDVAVARGSVQAAVQAFVSHRLETRPEPCRVALRPVSGRELWLDLADHPGGGAAERHPLSLQEGP
jgi:two-component system, LytTR family, sensor kinase